MTHSILTAFYTFLIVLFPKVSVVHLPDLAIGMIFLHGLSKRIIRKFIFSPEVLFLLFVVLSVSITQVFTQNYKPFWQYHILKIIIYSGAALNLVASLGKDRMKIVYWSLFWGTVASFGVFWETFSPQTFPAFFQMLKVESFWGESGETTLSYDLINPIRSSGFYPNYQEAGFVLAITAIVAIAQVVFSKNTFRSTALLICCFLINMIALFLTGTRTAMLIVFAAHVIFMITLLINSPFKIAVFSVKLIFFLGLLILLGILFYSEYGDIPILLLTQRIEWANAIFETLQGRPSSSVIGLMQQYIFPDSIRVWILGDGAKPWTSLGSETDVGYLQLLWGTGLFGLVAFCLYYWRLVKPAMAMVLMPSTAVKYWGIAIFFGMFLANFKGNFFIGNRTGGVFAIMYLMFFWYECRLSLNKAWREG